MIRGYNSKVREKGFQVGDMLLRRVTLNTRNLADGKLGPNWEGPYIVNEIQKNGTYVLIKHEGKKVPRPWNAENLLPIGSRFLFLNLLF